MLHKSTYPQYVPPFLELNDLNKIFVKSIFLSYYFRLLKNAEETEENSQWSFTLFGDSIFIKTVHTTLFTFKFLAVPYGYSEVTKLSILKNNYKTYIPAECI